MWEVRFTVLQQLLHTRAQANGEWTIEPPEPVSLQAERLYQKHELIKRRIQT